MRHKLLILISSIWAIPSLVIIRLVRSIILVRFGTFYSSRIAHFVFDTTMQFIEHNTENNNIVDLYWMSDNISNKYWSDKVKENFHVYQWVEYLAWWNRVLPGGRKHFLYDKLNSYRSKFAENPRDRCGLLEREKERIRFSEKETSDAKNWMKTQGWTDGEKFVCLQVRDSAYLSFELIHNETDWDYHDYRDSDISTYIPAMEWLADQGVWVFRMGKIMKEKMLSDHSKVVDYAFHPERSDFLDIWLFANCDLCISTGSGPDVISSIYQKPVMFINYLPLIDMFFWANTVNHPKNLVWNSSKKFLTLEEYLKHGYHSLKDYNDAGISIVNLAPDEIMSSVQEYWKIVNNNWTDVGESAERQRRFWNTLKSTEFIHPQARVSDCFLSKFTKN